MQRGLSVLIPRTLYNPADGLKPVDTVLEQPKFAATSVAPPPIAEPKQAAVPNAPVVILDPKSVSPPPLPQVEPAIPVFAKAEEIPGPNTAVDGFCGSARASSSAVARRVRLTVSSLLDSRWCSSHCSCSSTRRSRADKRAHPRSGTDRRISPATAASIGMKSIE